MKKILLFLFVCIVLSGCKNDKDEVALIPDKEYAGTVTIDNVLYISDDGVTAYVKDGKMATGEVLIPDFVTIKGRQMPVTSIYGTLDISEAPSAFSNNRDIVKVTIGDNLREIGDFAFYSCYGLTDIYIPNSVTIIGRSAFRYCSKLRSVDIPGSVTDIYQYAFYSCNSMTSVTIPNSVINIGSGAFDIQYLTEIIIGESVRYIGPSAFSTSAFNTASVYVKAKTPPVSLGPIFNLNNGRRVIIYVPSGTKELYDSSEYWAGLDIIEYTGDMSDIGTTN